MKLWPRPAPSTERFAQRAGALRSLAALLAGGDSAWHALQVWHRDGPESLRRPLLRLGRQVAVGAPVPVALAASSDALGRDARTMAALWACGSELGANLAAMIESLADVIEARRASAEHALALTAGAKLSGRLVAGLPLLCLPLLPATRAPMADAPGLLMVGTGVLLAAAGMRWIVGLVPAPVEDPVAELAGVLAASVEAGPPVEVALETLTHLAPGDLGNDLGRAQRVVRMGATWTGALQRSDSGSLRALGWTLGDAQDKGLPVAERLERFAAARRADQMRAFEQSLRRAPVLMVIPLTLCVLPAFALLALGPFLRGLAGA